MDFKIHKILLWPKNDSNKIRVITFKCSGVEVISGWSQRGKSALIQIIDYCLGSDKCAIPIGRVRDSVEWFGLLLAFPKGKQVLVARRNPGNQPSSSDMVWMEGVKLKIPNVLERSIGRASVIERFNQLASLPSHGEVDDELTSFDGPPSFRDMAAFNFQPQHIIANPYTLFFKADTVVHREKLVRSVFPYVLGAVDSNTLELQAELRKLEQEARVKRDQLEQMEKAAAMWIGRLQNFISLMQGYGLLDESIVAEPTWTVDTYVALLRQVPGKWREDTRFVEIAGIAKQVRRQVSALQAEEKRLNREISEGERKFRKLANLQSASSGYQDALVVQAERLLPALWLSSKIKENHSCPICGSDSVAEGAIDSLAKTAQKIGEISSKAQTANEPLTTEMKRLEDEIAIRKNQLAIIEERLDDWEKRNTELKEVRSRRETLSGIVGQLTAVLETIDAASLSGKIRTDLATINIRIADLTKRVNPIAIRKHTEKALSTISEAIKFYAQMLQIEHSELDWRLDDRNLTLSTRNNQKTDFLWEIGSAANWMGYHVATLLALHEHFRSVAHNPVPKFLVIDQPSQAFFPEGVEVAKKAKGLKKVSDDMQRLKRLFKSLSEAISRTHKGLQIILLEHAEAETWRGIPHFSTPDGEWRQEHALIPFDWI